MPRSQLACLTCAQLTCAQLTCLTPPFTRTQRQTPPSASSPALQALLPALPLRLFGPLFASAPVDKPSALKTSGCALRQDNNARVGLQVLKTEQKEDLAQSSDKQQIISIQDPEEEQLRKASQTDLGEKPLSPKNMVGDKFDFDVKYDTMHSLAMVCKNLARFYKRVSKSLNAFYSRVDKKGENLVNKCRKSQSTSGFSSFLFIGICFLLVWIVYIALTSKSREITKPSSFDSLKQYIARNLIIGSFIFTAYGIIFLHITSYVLIILLFLVQAVPGLFVFLSSFYVSSFLPHAPHTQPIPFPATPAQPPAFPARLPRPPSVQLQTGGSEHARAR